MKLGTETGSLINHIMARGSVMPEIGMGATICGWSDRYPATIVSNGMSEQQEYEYTRNTNSPVTVFRVSRGGLRSKSGNYLCVGRRERYYDFSF